MSESRPLQEAGYCGVYDEVMPASTFCTDNGTGEAAIAKIRQRARGNPIAHDPRSNLNKTQPVWLPCSLSGGALPSLPMQVFSYELAPTGTILVPVPVNQLCMRASVGALLHVHVCKRFTCTL